MIREHAPKDARAQWQKVAAADGLAFIAPVYWLHFPAILKGWFERVFAYGFAYGLTREGWHGDVSGRVPLMHHDKALIITPTLFAEAAYKATAASRCAASSTTGACATPASSDVEHVYFYGAAIADPSQIEEHLREARRLGREFAVPAPAAAQTTRRERCRGSSPTSTPSPAACIRSCRRCSSSPTAGTTSPSKPASTTSSACAPPACTPSRWRRRSSASSPTTGRPAPASARSCPACGSWANAPATRQQTSPPPSTPSTPTRC